MTFTSSLLKNFEFVPHGQRSPMFITKDGVQVLPDGYFSYKFGENNEYELCFEPLLYDGGWYISLWKGDQLMFDKVPVRSEK